MKHTRKIEENFNIELSKDILLSLEIFLKGKLPKEHISSKIWIRGETWNSEGNTLFEIFENRQIVDNLYNISGCRLRYYNQNNGDCLTVLIISKTKSIEIDVDSADEAFAVGTCEIIKQYVLQNIQCV